MFGWLKHHYRAVRRRYHVWRIAVELRRLERRAKN